MKPVHWVGSSREDLQSFPKTPKKELDLIAARLQKAQEDYEQWLKQENHNQRRSSVTHGSGNVFADLGFADAEELQVKQGLPIGIPTALKPLLTQYKQGRLGIGQPDVSKLMNGRYTGYSTDRLIALLNALDVDVEIVVRPRSENENPRRGSVRVMEAVA